jgi:hypothetical protein
VNNPPFRSFHHDCLKRRHTQRNKTFTTFSALYYYLQNVEVTSRITVSVELEFCPLELGMKAACLLIVGVALVMTALKSQNAAEFEHVQNMAILQTSDILSEDDRIDEKISVEATFHLCTIIAT